MTTYNPERITEGMDVYDVNNDQVGSVDEILDAPAGRSSGSGGGYLRVPTGFLGLGTEHHIPFRVISRIDGERIYLSIPKEQLDELGFREAPTASGDAQGGGDAADSVRRAAGAREETTAVEAGQQRRLLLREEELIPRKRLVETGRVRLETNVVSEERTLTVPVTHEEVVIQRQPVERRPAGEPIGESERTIEVPLHEEQVTVEKQAVVYEEVSLGTRTVQEQESVRETVRREELDVKSEGDVPVDVERRGQVRPDRDQDTPRR